MRIGYGLEKNESIIYNYNFTPIPAAVEEALMKKAIWVVLILLLTEGCATTSKLLELFSQTSKLSELFSHARERVEKDSLPIVVMPHGRYPKSGEGFIVEIEFENTGTKTIKAVVFSLTPHNDLGKPVACAVKGVSCIELKAAGPFRAGTGYYSRFWANAWYSPEIYCLQLNAVTVVYLDETSQVIDKPELLNKIVIPATSKIFGLWAPPRIVTELLSGSYIGTCESIVPSPPARTR